MPTQAEQRAEIVREALSWLGTPYHHHGRKKGIGVDCLMLLAEVFERTGFAAHVEPGFYPHDWHLHRSEERYAAGLASYVRQLADGELPGLGDIGLFRFGHTFSHAGIVVAEGPQLIHAFNGRGVGKSVVLTRLDEAPLRGRPVQWWSAFKDPA